MIQETYNTILYRLSKFVEGHNLLKQFTHGNLLEMSEKLGEEDYPLLHVIPEGVQYDSGERTFTLKIVIADVAREIDNRANYQKEVLSDMIQIGEDLIAEIKNGQILFGDEVEIGTPITFTPFLADYTHTMTGITIDIDMTFPYNWTACEIPAEWTPIGGGGVPYKDCCIDLRVNGTDNVVQQILDLVAGEGITIVDNGDGTITFTATGGGGSVSWGSIMGTLANQVDLQNALDLKVDITSLSAVATSGDYNDLSNLPTIPDVLNDLTDVTITSPAGYDVLRYDNFTQQWINDSISNLAGKVKLDDLDDVDIITPSNGQVLMYDSTQQAWENATLSSLPPTGNAGGDLSGTYPDPTVHRIHGIDMQSGNPTDGDTWVYSNTNSKWQHQMLHASQVDNDSSVTGQHVDDALEHLDSTKEPTINAGTISQYYRGDKTFQTHNIASINDATTIGQSVVTLPNPSAIRYIRINADNTATAIDAATLRSELGIGNITGSGIITLGSDVSLGTGVLNTSFVDITGLSFPITAGRKYSFRGTFIITQSGVATGIRLSINANVAVNVVQFYSQVSLNQNSSSVWYGNAFNSGAPTTAPQNFYSNTIGMMNGYIDANNTGTAIFRFSKWAGNAGTTTVKAGSFVEYTIF